MEKVCDENKIFHLYTKYKHPSYNRILTSNEQISKFKEKIKKKKQMKYKKNLKKEVTLV